MGGWVGDKMKPERHKPVGVRRNKRHGSIRLERARARFVRLLVYKSTGRSESGNRVGPANLRTEVGVLMGSLTRDAALTFMPGSRRGDSNSPQ